MCFCSYYFSVYLFSIVPFFRLLFSYAFISNRVGLLFTCVCVLYGAYIRTIQYPIFIQSGTYFINNWMGTVLLLVSWNGFKLPRNSLFFLTFCIRNYLDSRLIFLIDCHSLHCYHILSLVSFAFGCAISQFHYSWIWPWIWLEPLFESQWIHTVECYVWIVKIYQDSRPYINHATT